MAEINRIVGGVADFDTVVRDEIRDGRRIGPRIACLANGIPVGLGTDTGCPYTTHYNMWRELQFFHVYCGVSNAEALYTATLGNAVIAGIDRETGSLEVGKAADFIVTKVNPLEDLSALRELEMVAVGGKEIRHPKVKKMKQVEDQLDCYMNIG